uniref:Uncharacterized protein n=1 Tax=viral metagenome TaxID=1070528 RepID=A0A6C0HFU8_9ZZZZ
MEKRKTKKPKNQKETKELGNFLSKRTFFYQMYTSIKLKWVPSFRVYARRKNVK